MATITPLNPLATHDPAASLSQNIFWKRVWNVALATSVIAFTALGVFAIALTTTLWPAHLPIVTIMVLAGGLPASSGLIKKLWDKAEYYQKEAVYDELLKKGVEAISTEELPSILKSLGFSSNADDSVKKTLLSRYNFLKDPVKALRNSAEIGEEVELFVDDKVLSVRPADYQISKVDFDDPKQVAIFEALQARQLKQQRQLQIAALTHLKAAYILHLIQKPEDMRTYQDFVKLTAENLSQHLIAHQAGDPSAHVLAKAGGQTYTRDQILATSTAELAKQIFGLKLNWF